MKLIKKTNKVENTHLWYSTACIGACETKSQAIAMATNAIANSSESRFETDSEILRLEIDAITSVYYRE